MAGGLLELAVTQFSLHALLDGFEVFLIDDLLHADDNERRRLFLGRICSRGGDVTTSRQLSLEINTPYVWAFGK